MKKIFKTLLVLSAACALTACATKPITDDFYAFRSQGIEFLDKMEMSLLKDNLSAHYSGETSVTSDFVHYEITKQTSLFEINTEKDLVLHTRRVIHEIDEDKGNPEPTYTSSTTIDQYLIFDSLNGLVCYTNNETTASKTKEVVANFDMIESFYSMAAEFGFETIFGMELNMKSVIRMLMINSCPDISLITDHYFMLIGGLDHVVEELEDNDTFKITRSKFNVDFKMNNMTYDFSTEAIDTDDWPDYATFTGEILNNRLYRATFDSSSSTESEVTETKKLTEIEYNSIIQIPSDLDEYVAI